MATTDNQSNNAASLSRATASVPSIRLTATPKWPAGEYCYQVTTGATAFDGQTLPRFQTVEAGIEYYGQFGSEGPMTSVKCEFSETGNEATVEGHVYEAPSEDGSRNIKRVLWVPDWGLVKELDDGALDGTANPNGVASSCAAAAAAAAGATEDSSRQLGIPSDCILIDLETLRELPDVTQTPLHVMGPKGVPIYSANSYKGREDFGLFALVKRSDFDDITINELEGALGDWEGFTLYN